MILLKNIFTSLILIFLILILHVSINSCLYAEEVDQSFTSIAFKLNLQTNTNRNLLHRFWIHNLGAEAEIEMPFYAGDMRAGLHLYQYNGRNEIYPDYLVSFFYIGWGVNVTLSSKISWFNGIRLGSYQMSFDDTDINSTQKEESELAVGIDSRVNLNISKKWSGQIGIGYISVFTYKRIQLLNLTIGIAYTIDSPTWLTEFFR